MYESQVNLVDYMYRMGEFMHEEDDVEKNPYPLDGKYIDEYDRQRCIATFPHCFPSPIDSLTGYWKCQK